MRDKIYSDAPSISLKAFFPSNKFRTVLEAQRDVTPGRSEIRVTIELERNSTLRRMLPEIYSDSMFVFGYVQDNGNIKGVFSGQMAEDYANRHIQFFEKEGKLYVLFENGSRTYDKVFLAEFQEFQELMDHCLHPNILKKKTVK